MSFLLHALSFVPRIVSLNTNLTKNKFVSNILQLVSEQLMLNESNAAELTSVRASAQPHVSRLQVALLWKPLEAEFNRVLVQQLLLRKRHTFIAAEASRL